MKLVQFLCLIVTIPAADPPAGRVDPDRDAASSEEILFYDRLHQTFDLLQSVVLPAYFKHFAGDPASLSILHHYDGRFAELRGDWRRALVSYHQSCSLAPLDQPHARMSGERIMTDARRTQLFAQDELARIESELARLAATAPTLHSEPVQDMARRGDLAALARWLEMAGTRPAVTLERTDLDASHSVARCSLYEPELLWAHRTLGELRGDQRAPAAPARARELLAERRAALKQLRDQPALAELSLRRFLDSQRERVWELGWLFRCAGSEHERAGEPDAARENYLNAWAIGDALFPPSERGRSDRFDRLFLVELGDVYARLGRYDLMLRYMYADDALPGRFELARPIADLARVAESVRLTHAEQSSAELDDELLPVSVSQILFEQPVAAASAGRSAAARPSRAARVGWLFIAGGVLVVGWAGWRVRRLKANARRGATRFSSSSRVE